MHLSFTAIIRPCSLATYFGLNPMLNGLLCMIARWNSLCASREQDQREATGACRAPAAALCHQVHGHRDGTRALAKQRHFIRLTAKSQNVVPHPLQGHPLVLLGGETPAAAATRTRGRPARGRTKIANWPVMSVFSKYKKPNEPKRYCSVTTMTRPCAAKFLASYSDVSMPPLS